MEISVSWQRLQVIQEVDELGSFVAENAEHFLVLQDHVSFDVGLLLEDRLFHLVSTFLNWNVDIEDDIVHAVKMFELDQGESGDHHQEEENREKTEQHLVGDTQVPES